jgi:hypothetical protein
MSALFGRHGRLFGVMAWALFAIAAAPAQADTVTVHVDSAHLMKLPERVATIVIGNPLIADATLQTGGILVLTGKGYGSTNLLALDRQGHVLMRTTVHVTGPAADHLVVVYRGVNRETYSCLRECEPRITLGDEAGFFTGALAETSSRNGAAAGNGAGGAPPAAPPAR